MRKRNQTPPLGGSCDIIIVGGGMVGMSLAIGCARIGLTVALIDRAELSSQLDEHFDGRVSAIARGSALILDSIGVWQSMLPHGEPILDIRVSDDKAPVFLHYDHKEIGSEPFGHIIENRHIRMALHTVATGHDNLYRLDRTTVESLRLEPELATIKISGAYQGEIRARMLIATDGKNSELRAMAGIGVTQWGYDQTAIVTTITHERPHHGLAQERFLPAGPFAVLPMQGNRSSLVWVEPDDRSHLYMDLPQDEFIQEISERVGGYLGGITSASHRFMYPLSLLHAKTYIAQRFALAGDAAHGMHPIAGQGVNLGFRDVAALLELIEKQRRLGLDIGSSTMLSHYERWRAFDNVAMLAATDGINRLFSNSIIPIQMARRFGLWGVSKIPPFKRFFMKHAMGLVGDLPEIVKKRL